MLIFIDSSLQILILDIFFYFVLSMQPLARSSPKSGDTSVVVKVQMCCHMPINNCLRCSNRLHRTLKVPEHPTINLLTRPSVPTLGTKASDILNMDLQSNTQQNIQLRIYAYKERERLEEEGIDDQLS
jgi:hypothetical protein